MSRIGNKPITVPAGIDVTIDGQKITVKGPKGTLERTVNDNISIKLENGVIVVARPNDEKENQSFSIPKEISLIKNLTGCKSYSNYSLARRFATKNS